MLCMADALDSLRWIQRMGGVNETVERANCNFAILQNWLDKQDWIENLVKNRNISVKYFSLLKSCLEGVF